MRAGTKNCNKDTLQRTRSKFKKLDSDCNLSLVCLLNRTEIVVLAP